MAGLIICEDMWDMDYATTIRPVPQLIASGAQMIINVSCSPGGEGKNNKRHRVVHELMREFPNVPFFYVNNTGLQDNGKNMFHFDGGTTVYAPGGNYLKAAQTFSEDVLTVDDPFASSVTSKIPPPLSKEENIAYVLDAMIYAIREFFTRLGFGKNYLVAMSGGLDSTLNAAIHTLALGPERVFGVNMPTTFNSESTKSVASDVAIHLGIHYAELPIQDAFDATVSTLEQTTFKRITGATTHETTHPIVSSLGLENIQARHRGSTFLAGLAPGLNALFSSNGNKSEIFAGYATLYADVNGAYANLGDLYKSRLNDLARAVNRRLGREIIPESLLLEEQDYIDLFEKKKIDKIRPSAELSEDHNVDQGKGDPIIYPYHDRLFYQLMEMRRNPEDILQWYKAGTLVKILGVSQRLFELLFPTADAFIKDLERWWNALHAHYFKRLQAPPIFVFTRRAFGFDLRESQVQAYETETYRKLKAELLATF